MERINRWIVGSAVPGYPGRFSNGNTRVHVYPGTRGTRVVLVTPKMLTATGHTSSIKNTFVQIMTGVVVATYHL
eukprot:2543893-Rhodomonas_salina.5